MSFQENFEAFSGRVTEAAQIAAQKAKDLALIARTKVQIVSEEDKIKKAQIELGKLCYRDFTADAEPERTEYLPWCEKINECRAAIEQLQTMIAAIRNSGEFTDDELEQDDISEDDFADGDEILDFVVDFGADESEPADETPEE